MIIKEKAMVRELQEQLEQKDKEIESLKSLEDHLNKRDKINREKIEKLEKVVVLMQQGMSFNGPMDKSVIYEALNQLNEADDEKDKEN